MPTSNFNKCTQKHSIGVCERKEDCREKYTKKA